MTTRTKERLLASGRKQVWLLVELRKRGVETSPSQLSGVLSGYLTGPKPDLIISTSDQILDEFGA